MNLRLLLLHENKRADHGRPQGGIGVDPGLALLIGFLGLEFYTRNPYLDF